MADQLTFQKTVKMSFRREFFWRAPHARCRSLPLLLARPMCISLDLDLLAVPFIGYLRRLWTRQSVRGWDSRGEACRSWAQRRL